MPEGVLVVCREVLVMVMRKHQRYFPLYKPATQDLLPFFITVANGPIDVPTVKVSLPSAFALRPVDVPTTQGQLALLFCLLPSLCLLSGSVSYSLCLSMRCLSMFFLFVP